MDIQCEQDGSVRIHMLGRDAACLAGREGFGDPDALRAEMQEKVTDAWYAASCPPEAAAA